MLLSWKDSLENVFEKGNRWMGARPPLLPGLKKRCLATVVKNVDRDAYEDRMETRVFAAPSDPGVAGSFPGSLIDGRASR